MGKRGWRSRGNHGVAIKLIKAGMNTREIVTRFETERRCWRSWITRRLQTSSTHAALRHLVLGRLLGHRWCLTTNAIAVACCS
jgi:hypothetical protein